MLKADAVDMSLETLRMRLGGLRADVGADGEALLARWKPPFARRAFRAVAANLANYIALRRRDLRDVQTALMPYGLSSLGRCESRVMPTLDAVLATLARSTGDGAAVYPSPRAFFRGERLLRLATSELFGPPRTRSTRVMVTLDERAASDADFVRALVDRGMDCARINSAHDTPAQWHAMIRNVRAAAAAAERSCAVLVDLAGPKMRIERAEPFGADGRIYLGDALYLTTGDGPQAPSGVSRAICSLPEIYAALRPGARVMIDDGRIALTVESADRQGALLRVTGARASGEKLKAEKGLNVPDTEVDIASPTAGDLAVLDAIAHEADLIGFSFVKYARDVERLQHEIALRRSGRQPGIVLKIETAKGVANLPELIVQSARTSRTAVMIARGDLAVEIGYRRLAEMQEEMLWICEAASVPVIWATQVLDGFIKKGKRSRAEFTDAAMSERADCVMLNKGPYVLDAMEQLDDLLGRMEGHQWKKTSRLRALHAWQ